MQILIGEKLLALRTQKNMTQEELAERLGVTRQSVSKWESNGTFPNMNKLLEICDIFQVSLDYLLRDIGGPKVDMDMEIEIEPELPLPPVTEYQQQTAKKRRPVSIYTVLCMILTGVLFLISCWLFGSLAINHIWNTGDREQSLMCVDTIYEQYTRARVTVDTGEGLEDRILWLDVDGVKENDRVFCYTGDANGLRVKYTGKTLALPGLMALVFFILLILLYMEVRREHESEQE